MGRRRCPGSCWVLSAFCSLSDLDFVGLVFVLWLARELPWLLRDGDLVSLLCVAWWFRPLLGVSLCGRWWLCVRPLCCAGLLRASVSVCLLRLVLSSVRLVELVDLLSSLLVLFVFAVCPRVGLAGSLVGVVGVLFGLSGAVGGSLVLSGMVPGL